MRIAVIGAGGKMGMRISANLEESGDEILYCETSPAGRQRVQAKGRVLVDGLEAASRSDVVILAVPDALLGRISEELVPAMRPGSVVLTLDPAAAYAGVLAGSPDIHVACAHPCHPSVFLERTSPAEWSDTFGGESAPQDVVAALQTDDARARTVVESVIRTIYAPVINIHWVSVKQLAILEPTLVETVACMVADLLAEALDETVRGAGVPEAAARAMLLGHIQIALTNSLRGSNQFSEGCRIAMKYGRESLIKDDWKRIYEDAELDRVIARMLKLDSAEFSG